MKKIIANLVVNENVVAELRYHNVDEAAACNIANYAKVFAEQYHIDYDRMNIMSHDRVVVFTKREVEIVVESNINKDVQR